MPISDGLTGGLSPKDASNIVGHSASIDYNRFFNAPLKSRKAALKNESAERFLDVEIRECPECQSLNIKRDFVKGEICCNECGLVIREDLYPQDFTARPAPTVDIAPKVKEFFSSFYRGLPQVLSEEKEADEAIYKGLSQQRLTHYGSKKGTADSIIKGLVLNRCLWDTVDYKGGGEFSIRFPKNISYLDIPIFFSVEDIKEAFEGVKIIAKNLYKMYNVTPPKNMNIFPDSFQHLIFDKERWLRSFTSHRDFEQFTGEREREYKWLLIGLCRNNIRREMELPFLIQSIMEKNKDKTARAYNYMCILCELYLIQNLEKEVIPKCDVIPIKLNHLDMLFAIWGVPRSTGYQKWGDIDDIFTK